MMEKRVIHPKSAIAPHPQLELFAVPPTQVSIERDIDSEIRPLSSLSSNQPLEFIINSSVDEYINFAETYIYVKAKTLLMKNDRSNPTSEDWDSVTPAQYFLHSIFSQCDVLIGNNEITNSPQTYQYRAFIESLLAFSESAKRTHLKASMYGGSEYRNQQIRPDDSTGNNGRIFEMMGRLHLDLTFQQKLMIGGCDIKIKILPSDPKFYFNISKNGLSASLEFLEVTLQVHKSRVFPSIVSAHAEAMRVSPVVYPITRCEVKRVGIPQGQLDFIQDVIRGPLPRRVLMMLVDTNAFNGSYDKDPFIFKNYGVNYCSVFVNSTQYPTKAFMPNFEKGLFTREYMKLMQALNQNGTDVYTDLTMESFKQDKTIFAFDFAPDLSSGPGEAGHANILTEGVLRLAIRFTQQTTEAINVLLYCEFDECFGIDYNRTVVKSFES